MTGNLTDAVNDYFARAFGTFTVTARDLKVGDYTMTGQVEDVETTPEGWVAVTYYDGTVEEFDADDEVVCPTPSHIMFLAF